MIACRLVSFREGKHILKRIDQLRSRDDRAPCKGVLLPHHPSRDAATRCNRLERPKTRNPGPESIPVEPNIDCSHFELDHLIPIQLLLPVGVCGVSFHPLEFTRNRAHLPATLLLASLVLHARTRLHPAMAELRRSRTRQ